MLFYCEWLNNFTHVRQTSKARSHLRFGLRGLKAPIEEKKGVTWLIIPRNGWSTIAAHQLEIGQGERRNVQKHLTGK